MIKALEPLMAIYYKLSGNKPRYLKKEEQDDVEQDRSLHAGFVLGLGKSVDEFC